MIALKKALIIQTAFTGDVVLATGVLETLKLSFPSAQIDFLVRKGNEGLLTDHPLLTNVLIWDKKKSKYAGLFRLIRIIRKEKYEAVINLQRFASTGLLTALSGAGHRVGYKANPFSPFFTVAKAHEIGSEASVKHEITRNFELVKAMLSPGALSAWPKLYPSPSDIEKVKPYKAEKYVTISPASVWFTKQWPAHKWVGLIERIPPSFSVYLLGSPNDRPLCEEIKRQSSNKRTEVLAGGLSLLESAALMGEASMNFTNDSAPLHMAGAMRAPVKAIFCSTVPSFGFGPFGGNAEVIETEEELDCRPCGLHGHKACPKVHFKCAESIDPKQINLRTLE